MTMTGRTLPCADKVNDASLTRSRLLGAGFSKWSGSVRAETSRRTGHTLLAWHLAGRAIQSVKEKREAVPLSLDSGDNLGAPTSGSALNEASHRSRLGGGAGAGGDVVRHQYGHQHQRNEPLCKAAIFLVVFFSLPFVRPSQAAALAETKRRPSRPCNLARARVGGGAGALVLVLVVGCRCEI